MQYQKFNCRIRGIVPLLMHNPRLSDPLDPISKQIKRISGKRAKTEADHEEMAKLEWYGGLYLNDRNPVIPGEMIEATLVAAAKKSKRGEAAKAGIICERSFELEYDGPKDPDEMWESGDFRFTTGVRVQRSRIMRTRPIFKKWEAELEVFYLDALLNKSDVMEFVNTAGALSGIGTWRPKFGRFLVA